MKSLFRFRWFRSTVRRHTHPIPKDTATIWKERLSKAYLILAVNIAGLILYQSISKDLSLFGDPNMTKEEMYLKMSKGKAVDVVEVRGFSVAKTYVVEKEASSEEKQ